MNHQAQTVILPRPVDLSAFALFLTLKNSGVITNNTVVRLSHQKAPADTPMFMAHNRVINLSVYGVHHESIRAQVNGLFPDIRRWINFLCFGSTSSHTSLRYLFNRVPTWRYGHTQAPVHKLADWISEHRKIDPWKDHPEKWLNPIETLLTSETDASTRQFPSIPKDKRFLHLPMFRRGSGFTSISSVEGSDDTDPAKSGSEPKDRALPDTDIQGTVQVELNESNILTLVGQSIAIGIGGVPNSGKSTLCVSLAAEMGAVIRSVQSRTGWPSFDLNIGIVNLDLATPTAEAIASGVGKNHEQLQAIKKKWTLELAEEARIRLEDARKNYSIVLCDLPGGDPDDITRTIAAGLDAGIMVTRDWEKAKKIWPDLFKSVSTHVVSRIRSRLPDEGFSSLATHRRPGERISGRVSGLFRSTKAWDRFIEYLALFLLFEILPNLFGRPLDKQH